MTNTPRFSACENPEGISSLSPVLAHGVWAYTGCAKKNPTPKRVESSRHQSRLTPIGAKNFYDHRVEI
jgi:hypothetical protein